MEPHGGEHKPHVPPPSLWPVGFAVGIVVLLLGLIVGWGIVLLGAVLAVGFGFLWIRDLAAGVDTSVPDIEPERREVGTPQAAPIPANVGEAGMPLPDGDEEERFPRSRFLEGATLGFGGVIGGMITLPVLGFTVLPAFVGQEKELVDVGALDDFPEGQWIITTFLQDPDVGEVSRRTAYVRHNGMLGDVPSVTIVSSRCAHLGCPVQPNGPVDDEATETQNTDQGEVTRIPTQPSGFGCPCHGGQYDTEGNRTAGPPVRALDRYEYRIRNDRLLLGDTYSVGGVDGEGKDAKISKYRLATPGVHIDGIEQLLYPIPVPK